MNRICEAEFEEYEGQFRKDCTGAYEDCHCPKCIELRRIAQIERVDESLDKKKPWK